MKIDGNDVEFAEGTVKDAQSFDERNLLFCKRLNLKGSSFSRLDVHFLENLEFIDISGTKIDNLDLRDLDFLK